MEQDTYPWKAFPGHDAEYWRERYHEGKLGWDLGEVSPPLQAYFDALESRAARILIPGAGQAWEAAYLHKRGFTQVHVLDWAPEALEALQKRVPDFPATQLHQQDFFDHQGTYDLVVEQTFFCAIPPPRRDEYLQHVARCLAKEGCMIGLLFNDPLHSDHPPYGGDEIQYRELLETHFSLETLETSPLSVKPRAGRELFFVARKKANDAGI